MIFIAKTKKNPSPMKLIIAEFMRYSRLYIITIVPTKHIIPQINGNRYKKESSIATLVVIINIWRSVWLENQDKNWDSINNIEPANPNNRKSKYFLIFIIYHICELIII